VVEDADEEQVVAYTYFLVVAHIYAVVQASWKTIEDSSPHTNVFEQKISGRSLSSWTLLRRESERKNERFQVVSAVCVSSNNMTDRQTLSKLTYSSKYVNPCA
jgi:hypothetical protein